MDAARDSSPANPNHQTPINSKKKKSASSKKKGRSSNGVSPIEVEVSLKPELNKKVEIANSPKTVAQNSIPLDSSASANASSLSPDNRTKSSKKRPLRKNDKSPSHDSFDTTSPKKDLPEISAESNLTEKKKSENSKNNQKTKKSNEISKNVDSENKSVHSTNGDHISGIINSKIVSKNGNTKASDMEKPNDITLNTNSASESSKNSSNKSSQNKSLKKENRIIKSSQNKKEKSTASLTSNKSVSVGTQKKDSVPNVSKINNEEVKPSSPVSYDFGIDRFDLRSMSDSIEDILNNKFHYISQDSDGRLKNNGIVFNPNGTHFYTLKSKSINMYNTETGSLVGGIVYKAVSDVSIISITFSEDEIANRYILIVILSSGSVEIYDAKLLTIITSKKLNGYPVCATKGVFNRSFYYAANGFINEDMFTKINKVTFIDSEFNFIEETIFKKSTRIYQIDFSCMGQFLVALAYKKLIFFSTESDKNVGHEDFIDQPTIFATSPISEFEIALGDKEGKIIVLRGESRFENNGANRTIYHWHSSGILSLAYSNDGKFILSGGSEAVLVYWQLATFQKDFLPRLGASLVGLSISPNDQRIGITLANNSIFIIDFESKDILGTVFGLQTTKISSHFSVHPSEPHVLLTSSPGMLQTFDVLNDNHISNLEVASFNLVNNENNSAFPLITHSDYSRDAKWIVTVDTKKTSFNSASILKFWIFDDTLQKYVLRTRVNRPHFSNWIVDVAITSYDSKKSRTLCATCDFQKVLFWECNGYDDTSEWRMASRSITIPGGDRDHIFRISFSHDGSTLIVTTVNQNIFIFDVSSAEQISEPILIPVKRNVVTKNFASQFIGDNSQYILNVTNHRINVVDSVKGEMSFYLDAYNNYEIVQVAASKMKFAVMVKTDFVIRGTRQVKVVERNKPLSIMMFSVANGVTLESTIRVKGLNKFGYILGMHFISVESEDDSLVIIGDSSYYRLISANIENKEPSKKLDSLHADDLLDGEKTNMFSSIFASKVVPTVAAAEEDVDNVVDEKYGFSHGFKAFQFVPSHQLAPPDRIFTALFSKYVDGLNAKLNGAGTTDKTSEELAEGSNKVTKKSHNKEKGQNVEKVEDKLVENSKQGITILGQMFSF
ncbi:WD repeat-containing protein 75 [Smittium mucronatum]|uniref:WD repeat-containing protein 75 n=1 Tax=Smittium mucronatum TaxID=133383 RepID=A0A1R0GNT9_9FUNG|nr:WD repeat-containing protein 75 [Smittium mucronatum]